MSIKQSIARISKSTTALNVLSCLTVVTSVVAAKKDKPMLAVGLMGFSTVISVREVYIRHCNGAKIIQEILAKATEVSEVDESMYQHTVVDFEPAEAEKLESNAEFKERLIIEFNEFKTGITRMLDDGELTTERYDTLIDNAENMVAKLAHCYPTYL